MALFQACLLMYVCVTIGKTSTINKDTPTDFRTKPNIFKPKSILRPEYGLLYEHIGQLYQGLQWYYLVIGIALPMERYIPDAYTDVTINCDYRTHSENDQIPVSDLMQMCVDFFSAITKKSTVLKKMEQQLKHKIHSDMPALLPNLMVNFHTQTPGQMHISPYAKIDEMVQLRNHNMTKRSLEDIVKIVSGIVKGVSIVGNIISGARTVGGMIIDGVNTIINYKKAKAMNAAIHTLNKQVSMNNEQIVRVRDHLLHVSKASLMDIKGDRKNLYQFNKDLDRIYEYTGILQNTTADKLTMIFWSIVNSRTNMRYMSRVLKFCMSHLEMQMHEYQDLTQAIDHFLSGLSAVNTGQLSPALISPDVLYRLITRVVTDIIRRNPDFIPVFTTLQNYYQQAMTSFTNTEKMLIVQIPILFKKRLQKLMNLYKMVTVPVPLTKTLMRRSIILIPNES